MTGAHELDWPKREVWISASERRKGVRDTYYKIETNTGVAVDGDDVAVDVTAEFSAENDRRAFAVMNNLIGDDEKSDSLKLFRQDGTNWSEIPALPLEATA
jgi:hypothetical protein